MPVRPGPARAPRCPGRGAAADEPIEAAHDGHRLVGVRAEGLARGRTLLGGGGGGLRHLLHLCDRLGDLIDALRLLAARLADLVNQAFHLRHALGAARDRRGDLCYRRGSRLRVCERLLDQGRRVLRRLGRPLSEGAHLVGDDREPHAGLSRTRCFDGRVQCQDIGLEGDLVDRLDDLPHFLARPIDRAHGGHHPGQIVVGCADAIAHVCHQRRRRFGVTP